MAQLSSVLEKIHATVTTNEWGNDSTNTYWACRAQHITSALGWKKKNAHSILSWKGQRLSTRSWWTNEGDQAGYVMIWGQTSFLSRGEGVLISWRLYILRWLHLSISASLKKIYISSGLWLTLSLIKRGNNSYTVRHSPPHGGMENSIVLNVLWDKLWVCGVVGGSLTLNEKKQQDGDR